MQRKAIDRMIMSWRHMVILNWGIKLIYVFIVDKHLQHSICMVFLS